MEKAMKVILFFYCIAAILFLLVLHAGFKAYKQHITHMECKCINNATIVSREITSRVVSSSANSIKRMQYSAPIKFEYEIDDKTYISDRFSVSGLKRVFSKEAEAQEFLKQFPVGKKVKAYYHPNSPQKAFLVNELGFGYCAYILLFNPLSFFIVLFCCFIEQQMGKKFGYIKRAGLNAWWFLIGILCFGYYFKYSRDIEFWVICASVIYGILGLIWVYILLSIPQRENED